MSTYRPLYIIAWCTAAFFLFLVLTVLFVPARAIQGVIARGLERQGYTMQAQHFGKAFPLGVKAEELEISDARGSLIKLDKASAGISLPALCTGKFVLGYSGEIGKGRIDGAVSLRRNGDFSLSMDNVDLADIPFFQTVADARVSGDVHARASFQGEGNNYRGELRIWADKTVLNGLKVGGTPMPDSSYETIQGLFKVAGNRGVLESFTLKGRGLYVRLKGQLPIAAPLGSSPLNLTLELMPKPEFLESQKFVFLLLTKYLTTPGHYRIPVRGTLASPVIQ